MSVPFSTLHRRRLLQGAGLLTAAAVGTAWAQPGKTPVRNNRLGIAQIVDFSQGQQDVSKDFLIGTRAAWQEINVRGGVRGRPVQHITLETDGSAGSLRTALDAARDNPVCVALSGTVGDQIASQLVAMSRQSSLHMAHVAPWLQNSSLEINDQTFPIFAARQEQIGYALKTLAVMGLKELGAVYATAGDYNAYQLDVERVAAGMQLKLQSFRAGDDLRALGQRLTPATPAVLLFIGGTPELAEFTQGLARQARQRYIVALADVNLQTLQQMGAARNAPVIATQPVPLVNASLPVVRTYRETLAKFFDEPPTPLSLAGFIAARYTYEVLSEIDGTVTRASALAAFQKRTAMDLGGFRVSFSAQNRSGAYVTQSMMAADGRMIG